MALCLPSSHLQCQEKCKKWVWKNKYIVTRTRERLEVVNNEHDGGAGLTNIMEMAQVDTVVRERSSCPEL